jgi:dCMP deaminase
LEFTKWDRMYMDLARRVASESNCTARSVGCLLVKSDNILGVGINGSLPKSINCNDIFLKEDGLWYRWTHHKGHKSGKVLCENQEEHHEWSMVNEIHAEVNAISKAHKSGASVEGSTAYVTHSPCFNCAKSLIVHGVRRIIYGERYDGFEKTLDLYMSLGVEIHQLKEEV